MSSNQADRGVPTEPAEEPYSLGCHEVWGGHRKVARTVALSGLVAWVYSSPLMGDSGGDLHYLSVCDYGIFSRVLSRVLLADVMGHGQGVSTLAEQLHGLMHRHINTWDQSDLMKELNLSFPDGDIGVTYATLVLLGYNSTNGQLVFTNAGHPPPLWYRASHNTWSWLDDQHASRTDKATDLPVGLIPGTDYHQKVVSLAPADRLMLYTDGISDAENSAGEPLGRDRLLRWAQLLPAGSAADAGQAMLDRVNNFRRTPPNDDESLILLQPVAS